MEAPAATTSPRGTRLALLVAGLGATVPIVVSLVRTLRDGWYPIGDDAYFSLRARDVLTANHPLLGTWTSASLSVGADMNNPGPLHWDLLAVPAKIAPVAGPAVGTAIVNLACIGAMAVVARRQGGNPRAVAVLAAAAALAWTMGTELVVDPWQPHALLFPFLLFLVLTWNLVEGDLVVLPGAVAVASLLVQTHLSYSVLVPALGGLGLAALGLRWWRIARRDQGGWPAHRRSLVRAGTVTLLVAALAWSQPIVEQLSADDGNLGRVLRNGGGGDGPRLGPANAARIVADVVAAPPAWGRPAFGSKVAQANAVDGGVHVLHVPSTAWGVLALALLGVALGLSAWHAQRRGDAGSATGVAVALWALGLALVTTAALPVGPVGFGVHQVRWLWPIGILASVALALAMAGRSRGFVPMMAVLAVLAGAAALPTYDQVAGPSADGHAIPVMLAVAQQLDDVSVDGPVLLAADDLRKMPIFEPYSAPMMLELGRRGIGFVVDDPSLARQVGEGRLHPERASVRMVLLQGDHSLDAPAGGRRIAYVAGLDRRERAELEDLVAAVHAMVARDGVPLTAAGRDLAARGLLPGVEPGGSVDPDAVMSARTLVAALDAGALSARAPGIAQIRRYAALQQRWDVSTLAVYVVPLDEPAQVIDS